MIASLLAARMLAAQNVLAGRVVDETDAPLPQAHLTVRPGPPNPSAEVHQASSDPTGSFSVSLPSPGDYLVNVQREGFYELRDYPVHVAGSSEVMLALTPIREIFQSVDVTDAPSPVNLDQTSQQSTITGTQINDVPYPDSHSLRNAMKLMPGVVQDKTGALHFEGAAENQVFYALNGFNIGDPLTGRFETVLAVESVRSLDFSSGRFSPEFGKGSAGVLAIHTETGADALHYTATNFVPGIDTHSGFHLGNWSPRFGVSGPLWRGRAWFSDNLGGQYQESLFNDLPKGQNQRTAWLGTNLLHTQVNVTSSNILLSDFLVNADRENRAGLGPLDPVSTTTTQRSREYFASLKDQIVLGRGLLLEVGYAHSYVFGGQEPQGDQPYIISPSGRSGNYFIDSTQQTTRDQFLSNVFLPMFQFAGTHQLKVGADLDRLTYTADFQRTAYNQIGFAGNLLATTSFQGMGAFSRPSAEASSYIVDTWKPRRDLRVDIGVRQDWDELVRQVALSPRLSFSYSPFDSGRTRISGGYAITYDGTNLSLFAQPLDQQSLTIRYNPDGTVAGPPTITRFIIDNARLRTPRSTNWSASVDQQLPHRVFASVNYLWRHTGDGFVYAIGPDGLLHLTNQRTDEYDSTSFIARQTLSKGFEWMASYTYSRAFSNSVLNLDVDQTTQVVNNFGAVPWDAPHRFLASAYLPVPKFKWLSDKWAVAALADARSGFPFSVVDQFGSVVGSVDSHRYPTNFDLNLHLERRFTFRGYRFALRGGFNNILDHPNPIAVNNVIGAPQFLTFYGKEGRHFVLRVRFFGRANGA